MLARDLALAAERCDAELGYPGLSVFAAARIGFRELLLAARPLRAYSVVRRASAGQLRAIGCTLIPTGAPPHFTLRLPDAGFPTLAAVREVFGPPIPNPVAR